MAIANRMARALYHILKNPDTHFKDIGHLRADSQDQQIKRALAKLKKLGVQVQFHTHQKIIEAKKILSVSLH